MVRLPAVTIAVLVFAAAWPTTGQEGRPAQTAVVEIFPSAAVFGEGWVRQGEPQLFAPETVFRDGAIAAYGGPLGARVVLVALVATDERVAVRAAWEAAGEIYDRYRFDLIYDDAIVVELAALPPPAVCVEAKRIEGMSERDVFPTGVVLCAAQTDPNLILLAIASGEVGGRRGYRAADAVLDLAVNAGGAALPAGGALVGGSTSSATPGPGG